MDKISWTYSRISDGTVTLKKNLSDHLRDQTSLSKKVKLKQKIWVDNVFLLLYWSRR